MSYKKIALLDSTDFTDKLDELFLEYARNNEFNQDTLIHFTMKIMLQYQILK